MRRADRPVAASSTQFGALLRRWRHHRGLSQLTLAHEAGLSPRHLSFLESGRSSPSRAMIVRLAESLAVPLRECNHLLLSAGYAPAYSQQNVDSPQMSQIRRTIEMLLERHDPYPAYAMDGGWNVVAANRSHERLVATLVAGTGGTGNILDLVFDPALLRPRIVNWEECATVVLRRVMRQLATPSPHPELAATFEKIRSLPGVDERMRAALDPGESGLFIPIALQLGDHVVRLMTTILTFGAAVDVNLEELVVECFFPADAESEAVLGSVSGATLPPGH